MKEIYKKSFLNSFAALVYIVIVATLIQNGDRIFGKMTNLWGPIAFLLLFTLSALVVGGLVLGKPLMLYLDNQKKEAIRMLLATGGWLLLYTLAVILILVIK